MASKAQPTAGGRELQHLRHETEKHLRRWTRYVPVSVASALLYNVIMIGLDRLGVHYALCQAATAVVLLPVGYLLQSRLTFGTERSFRDFGRYCAALMTNYPVAVAVLWLLCDVLQLDMLMASPIAMVVMFLWNYMTTSWAFSKRDSDAGANPAG